MTLLAVVAFIGICGVYCGKNFYRNSMNKNDKYYFIEENQSVTHNNYALYVVDGQSNSTNINEDTTMKNTSLTILIYGSFYDMILFEELVDEYCTTGPLYSIIRSTMCEPHDAVIVHFDQVHEFMRKCGNSLNSEKKVMVIFSMEPPQIVGKLAVRGNFAEDYHIITNSYHRESTVETGYFKFRAKKSVVDYGYLENVFKTRNLSAFAVISNCATLYSPRLKYLNELSQYFNVEKYGSCFENKISGKEYIKKLKNQMFFLSFENRVCTDYVTEKYCNPIKFGAIPIVMSYQTNLINLIPGSFINTLDFPSPRRLAKHLLEITKNYTLYKSYFLWKQSYHLERCRIVSDVCKMVTQIHLVKLKGTTAELGVQILTSTQNCTNLEDLNERLFQEV